MLDITAICEKILNNKEIQQHIDTANDCFYSSEMRRNLQHLFEQIFDMVDKVQEGNLSGATMGGVLPIVETMFAMRHINDSFIKKDFDFEKATAKALANAKEIYYKKHKIKGE